MMLGELMQKEGGDVCFKKGKFILIVSKLNDKSCSNYINNTLIRINKDRNMCSYYRAVAAPEQDAIVEYLGAQALLDIYKISPRKNTQGLVSSLPRETSLEPMGPMPIKPTLKLRKLNSLLKDGINDARNALQQTTPCLEGARPQVNMDKQQIMNRYFYLSMKAKEKQKRKRTFKRSSTLPEERFVLWTLLKENNMKKTIFVLMTSGRIRRILKKCM